MNGKVGAAHRDNGNGGDARPIQMGREFKIGDEPVPGYRLVAMLGKGGFGTVWRAVGPGRTEVALKITDMLDSKRGMREFKSLRLMKRVRHPNLVPIVAIWLIDADGVPLDDDSIDLLGTNVMDSGGRAAPGTSTVQFNAARAERLIVAMGLGEKDLFDLLREYQGNGEPAIPVDKLLDYMEEAAKAIDFLNEPRHDLGEPGQQAGPAQLKSIYHCDIKPGNIMLVGSAAQVCDFGLARREDVRATSVALSCAYGAPELYWENKPTNGTDQYSLAITYYELRCGELPFGPDMSQLEVMQTHRDGKLDFGRVGEAEQAVLKRATNPRPPERYPSCKEMVASLKFAVQGGTDLLRYATDSRSARIETETRTTLVPGREMVPGYRLGEHVFHADTRTDVWSATGPSGKHCSLWIYDLTSLSETVDLSALRSIQQEVNHPHLARLFGWWCLNAAGEDITASFADRAETSSETRQLVIASESARVNLAHKAQERRELTGAGLPAEELLDFMRQASSGIDALNAAAYGPRYASLIHTDVRPANMLLVGNTVKLANLAWCRALEGEEAMVSGLDNRPPRITLAPELAEGRLHRRSDQFSLAVSYAQLRCGKLLLESGLPSATTQFFSAPELDLSALSSAERSVLDRALSRDPRQRYPSCQAMVEALSQVVVMPRVPETVPPHTASDEARRGTMMPEMPLAPNVAETSATKHRETRAKLGSTTDPDVQRPSLGSRRSKSKFIAPLVLIPLVAWAVVAYKQSHSAPTVDQTPSNKQTQEPKEIVPEEAVPQPPATAPEALVGKCLEQADRDLREQAFDDAKQNLAQADAKINAEFSTRSDLRRRSAVLHAYLAWQQKAWDDSDTWLHQAAKGEFGAAEARAQTQFYLLRTLVPARYDGGELAMGADLDAISLALEDLQRADAHWEDGADRLLTTCTRDLIAESAGRLAVLVASSDAGQRSLGERISQRLDLKSLPNADELLRLFAVNKTIDLLQSGSPWAAVQKSLEPWKTSRDLLPHAMVARLVTSLAIWARRSKEAGSLDKAIEEIDRFALKTQDLRREFAGLLIEQLVGAASQPEPDWKQLAKMCRRADEAIVQAGGHPRDYFVKACEAECQLETASSESLASRISDVLKGEVPQADRGYVNYVVLRARQSDPRVGDEKLSADELTDKLCDELNEPPPILATPMRRSRAAELLIGSARRLLAVDGSDGPLAAPSFGGAEHAEQAYRWLSRAQQVAEGTANKPSDEFVLDLAVAAAEKPGADLAQASSLLDTLAKRPSPPPKVLLMSARWLEQSHADDAVPRYAQALQAVLKLGTAKNESIYEQIVAPGIRLVEAMTEKQRQPVATEAALLYANKGRLIRLDTAVDLKVFEESNTTGADAVFAAYDKAIGLDASVADYYIRRGTARYSTSVHNDLAALKRDDIERARALLGGQETAGFHSLTGVANLLEARSTGPLDRKGRVDFYKKAVDDERRAVDRCDPQSDDYPQFLLLHSMACLELANFTTEPDEIIRRYLDDAVESAQKAIADGRGAHPEFTYLALGNAHEDYGLLVRDFDVYRQAERDFDEARLKALDTLSPPEEAQISLGRVRYRLATCGAVPAATVDGLLTQGLADLQAAIDLGQAPPGRIAEAYWWQAQIHAARMQRAADRIGAPAARNNAALVAGETNKYNAARAAANAALAQCVQRVEQGGPTWCMYQIYWAGLGTTLDERRSRARAALDAPSSKADGAQRAEAMTLVATSYAAAGATATQRRGQLEQGLREYEHYLPWLPDVSKAQAQDAPALLALSEFLAADRDFWREKRDLCKASAERALALATESRFADLAARAHEALANHAVLAANQTTTVELESLRLAANHLKAAVEFDDKLPTSGLTAFERQKVRTNFAGGWRAALAFADGRLADSPRTPAADAKRYLAEGLAALQNAKDLPAGLTAVFQKRRLELLRIQQQLQLRK
ncbi:MAG TPA: protein kinase [Pirellulales bacterium]|nr:protein kinase [Pirellulales bacterium]